MCCSGLTIEVTKGMGFAEVLRAIRAEGAEVQTVICSREKFATVAAASSWCREHGFRTDKVDETEDSYRFRQFDPGDCAEGALDNGETFATIQLTDGVQAVVCQKKAGRQAQAVSPARRRSLPFDVTEMRYALFAMDAHAVKPEEAAARGLPAAGARPKDEEDDKHKGRTMYEVAISSEAEIERWFGIEILSHEDGAIDEARMGIGASLLVNHDYDQHVGVIEPGTFRVDADKKARAYARFSSHQQARDVERDVEEKTRTQISVGYFIKDYEYEPREVGKDEKGRPIIEDVYRITRWQPVEVSIVSAAADITVGVGRSVAGRRPASTGGGPSAREETMKKKIIDERGAVIEVPEEDSRPAATAEQVRAASGGGKGAVAVLDEPLRNRDKDTAEIAEMCDDNKIDRAQRKAWIEAGLTPEQVSREIIKKVRTIGTAQPSAENLNNDLPLRDRKRYSFARAILTGEGMRAGQDPKGVEGEYHQEMIRREQQKPIKGGILVPMDRRSDEERWQEYEQRAALAAGQRTLDSKTLTKGTETVFERPGELIELLRNTAVVARLGARLMGNLMGPIGFTKQSGGLSVFWVGENPATDVTASDVAFGLVNMIPKTLQGTTAYSRQLLVQSSLDIEAMIREEFAVAHALRLDKTVFYGLGAAGEPMGIYKAPDVNVRAVGGGAPDADDVIQTSVAVAEDNALLGTIGWALTPGLIGKLKTIPAFTGSTEPIYRGTIVEGVLDGYRAMGTNQLSKAMTGSEETGGADHGAVFGNWRDVVIGMFAAMELVVDPYAQKKKGLIEVTSFQMADIIFRHGESFCKWTGATGPF